MVLKEVIKKSIRLIPMFVILFTGFLSAIKMRSAYKHGLRIYAKDKLKNQTGEVFFSVCADEERDAFRVHWSRSAITLFNMIIGQFSSESLTSLGDGIIFDNTNRMNWADYAIFFLFTTTMPIFIYNLFIGITVDEISKIVEDAEVQNIKIKTEYVINLQSKLHLDKFMVYKRYNFNNEPCLIFVYKWIRKNIYNLFFKEEKKLSDQIQNDEVEISEVKTLKQDISLIKSIFMQNETSNGINQILDQLDYLKREMASDIDRIKTQLFFMDGDLKSILKNVSELKEKLNKS